jgi:protein-S-isoprenylcysteine O-methyltransferase Ste14
MGPQTGKTSESFIRATGQSWKMAAGVVLFAVAVIAAAVFHLGPDQTRSPSRTIEAVAGLLACAAVWWIRCPACRRSVGFWSFKQVVGKFSPADLLSVAQCPYCSPTQRSEPRGS